MSKPDPKKDTKTEPRNDAPTPAASTALILSPQQALAACSTTDDAIARWRELQDFVSKVMIQGEDYGKVPGVERPTLLKPGAEKLQELYGLRPEFDFAKTIEAWSAGDYGRPFFYYLVRCTLYRKADGAPVGQAFGSCNSFEDKYAWRWVWPEAVPPHVDKATCLRREFTSKGGKKCTKYRTPNDDPFSQVHTIQQIACKRASVAATRAATRSAGLFTQDVEDMSPAAREANGIDGAIEGEFVDAPPDEDTGPNQRQIAAASELEARIAATSDKKTLRETVWPEITNAKDKRLITPDAYQILREVFAKRQRDISEKKPRQREPGEDG